MDSLNFVKGYDQVNNLENQSLPPKKTIQKPLIITITVSAIVLLTLIIGAILATVLIHQSKTESPESPSLSSNTAESIKIVCNVTRYPDSCFTSISSLNISIKPDPEAIFKLSLQLAINELTNLSSSFKTLNDLNSEAALGDCVNQIDDARSRLNDSVSAMEVGPGEMMLTEVKINNIQTWISGAMTDQETCLDGLEEMGSTVLDEVKAMMQRSEEFVSNSLAIIANIQTLLQKFDLTMH